MSRGSRPPARPGKIWVGPGPDLAVKIGRVRNARKSNPISSNPFVPPGGGRGTLLSHRPSLRHSYLRPSCLGHFCPWNAPIPETPRQTQKFVPRGGSTKGRSCPYAVPVWAVHAHNSGENTRPVIHPRGPETYHPNWFRTRSPPPIYRPHRPEDLPTDLADGSRGQ